MSYIDEIGELAEEIITRLKIVDEISLSARKKTIKVALFDEMVDFRDSLNKFLSRWDLADRGILNVD